MESKLSRQAITQARPDLAVVFTVERAIGYHLFNLIDKLRIRHGTLRPRAAAHGRFRRGGLQVAVHAGAVQAPDPADTRDTVGLARGDRDDGTHRFELRLLGAQPSSLPS